MDGSLTLHPRPPFRLDLTVWVLKRREDYRVERWDGRVYRRALRHGDGVLDLAVTQDGSPDAPCLRVNYRAYPGAAVADADQVIGRELPRLLGLDVDLSGFYALAGRDPLLAPLADRFRGAKPTRYPSLFEALVNAITCQQVTLTFGLRVLSRLAEAYGQPIAAADGVAHTFPTPERLAAADPDHLRALGLSRQKARAVLELAHGVGTGRIHLERIESLDDEPALRALVELRGVGRWTAEYVLLRGLGRTHIFPGDDVGARNALERWLGSPDRPTYDGVHTALRSWAPYAGLIYFHLLLDGLSRRGAL